MAATIDKEKKPKEPKPDKELITVKSTDITPFVVVGLAIAASIPGKEIENG